MNSDTLRLLERAHEDLIAALDGGAVDAVETRLEALRSAVAAVRAEGAWHPTPELEARARRIAQLGEAVRIRVNFLTDLTRQRLHMLAAARGQASGTAYTRPRMTGAL